MSGSSKNIYPVPSGALAARMLGGEMMIMSVRASSFFTLNEIATVIWRAADGRTALAEIARTVCDEFDVDFATAYRDAEDLVRRLAEHGILTIADRPLAAKPKAASPAP